MTESDQREQRSVRYEGSVQGVGFRYTTIGIARQHRVAGYVRNMPDGRVLLVAEGETAELDRFLAAVDEVMGRHIRGRSVETLPATGEFQDFAIRY